MSPDETDLTRRAVLRVGAGGALSGMLPAALAAEAEGGEAEKTKQNIYDALGVTRLINAAGTMTALGGSLMPPEVIAAWTEA